MIAGHVTRQAFDQPGILPELFPDGRPVIDDLHAHNRPVGRGALLEDNYPSFDLTTVFHSVILPYKAGHNDVTGSIATHGRAADLI